MAKRQIFYSFHYQNDYWRSMQVRNIGAIEGNKPVSHNDWEEVKKGGDSDIKEWINGQLKHRSCTIVLIGEDTAGRKWINYEIEKSWDDGKGVFGIYIHNLKHSDGKKSSKGSNPFEDLPNRGDLSSKISCYNPSSTDSQDVYEWIEDNIEKWVEKAIDAR